MAARHVADAFELLTRFQRSLANKAVARDSSPATGLAGYRAVHRDAPSFFL
jgi:hypothetical protein